MIAPGSHSSQRERERLTGCTDIAVPFCLADGDVGGCPGWHHKLPDEPNTQPDVSEPAFTLFTPKCPEFMKAFNGIYIDSRLLFLSSQQPVSLVAHIAVAPGAREKLSGKLRLIDADEFFAEAEAEEQHVLEMERERCFDATEISQGHCVIGYVFNPRAPKLATSQA